MGCPTRPSNVRVYQFRQPPLLRRRILPVPRSKAAGATYAVAALFGILGLLRFKWTWLFAGIVLLLFGTIGYLSAHPSQPVEIDGTISDYVEHTTNDAYSNNTLLLAGDSTTYTLDKTTFHPTLPDEVFKDGKISIWIDAGSTTVIAITLYDENDQNPTKYTTSHYDNPNSELSDSQTAGIAAGVIGVFLIAIFAVWFVAGRRQKTLVAAGGPVMGTPTPAPGSSVGVSPDGKWYWDLTQWHPVSEDGRYRWDGTQWREMGTAYSAKGAPPPPAS
jgi:hypothetical protein